MHTYEQCGCRFLMNRSISMTDARCSALNKVIGVVVVVWCSESWLYGCFFLEPLVER